MLFFKISCETRFRLPTGELPYFAHAIAMLSAIRDCRQDSPM